MFFSEFLETFLVGLHGVYTKTWFAFDMFPSYKREIESFQSLDKNHYLNIFRYICTL
jgi:hypothetical protein